MEILKQVQQIYHYLLNHQRELRNSLLVASLIVLYFCRQISGYFSNYDVNYWFDYFVITERFSMLLLLLSASSYLKKECWLIYETLLALLVQDFVDRVWLNVKIFNINDVICIVVIATQLMYQAYARFKKQIHIFFSILSDWRNHR